MPSVKGKGWERDSSVAESKTKEVGSRESGVLLQMLLSSTLTQV